MQAKHIVIRGRVQGVGFRAWAQGEARELGLAGWVRNRQDGTVEAHLEGPAEALDDMVERLGKGPVAANVEGVRAEAAEVSGASRIVIRDRPSPLD